MNRVLFIAFLLISAFSYSQHLNAQATQAETAKTFIREGDYSNAILVLNRALQTDRENTEMKKDLAFAYFMQGDYTRGISTIKPVVESNQADVQSFQVLAMIYKATGEAKETEKLYRNGLKKFPQSGALYNEYGEMLWTRQEYMNAVSQWLTGIRNDPN